MRTARVELVRVGVSHPADSFARAGEEAFQVCRATVSTIGHTERVAMFRPVDGQPSSTPFDALAGAIEREGIGTIPVVVRASSEGRMTLSTPTQDERQLFAVAAVGAAARVSWAWDDSPVVAVNVNGMQIVLDPQYSGEAWLVAEIISPAV